MIGTKKKRYRTVEVADPDLGRAGVEVEGAPLADFRRHVEAAYDFDADLRGFVRTSVFSSSSLGAALASQATSTAFTPSAVETGQMVRGVPLAAVSDSLAAIDPSRLAWSTSGRGSITILPCRSLSIRFGILAKKGSAKISVQRARLNPVCDLRSGSSIVIGTPGR